LLNTTSAPFAFDAVIGLIKVHIGLSNPDHAAGEVVDFFLNNSMVIAPAPIAQARI
jgi:hypothetical protein